MYEHTATGSLLRSTQAYCQLLSARHTCDYGVAFYSERYADLPEANQFREVVVEDPANLPTAIREAETFFTEQGLTFHRWAPATGTPTPPEVELLTSCGFVLREYRVMQVTHWPETEHPPEIHILPARAMRTAFRGLMCIVGEICAPGRAGLYAQACEERLDEAQMDMFLAVADGTPAGAGALFQVGDIGRIVGPHVTPQAERRLVYAALLNHALAMARRLGLRSIVTQVPVEDAVERALCEAGGFSDCGPLIEFHRSP